MIDFLKVFFEIVVINTFLKRENNLVLGVHFYKKKSVLGLGASLLTDGRQGLQQHVYYIQLFEKWYSIVTL